VCFGKPQLTDAAMIRILSLVDGLTKSGNSVKLVTFFKGSFSPSDYRVGKYVFRMIPLFNPFSFMRCSIEMIHEYNPDIIIAHTNFPAFILSFLRKISLKKIPLIFDMHGSLIDETKLTAGENKFAGLWPYILLTTLLEKFTFSSRVLCVSRKALHRLNQKNRMNRNKAIYIPNGADLNFFKPHEVDEKILELKRRFNFENRFVFGYIGGFQTWQGVENFVKAALLTDNEQLAFFFVGAKNSYATGNITMLRKVPRKELPSYYSLCDVLVLPRPSHKATEVAAPTKFAEYAAMGKPLLVTNVGDAALLTEKYHCGIVLSTNSPEALQEGFKRFIKLPHRELQEMGKNSRKLAEEEFDWNKIIGRLSLDLIKLKKCSNN
jgi:glycosyltransferase involved in cell wall biosynthesis